MSESSPRLSESDRSFQPAPGTSAILLDVQNVLLRESRTPINLQVHEGEIIGLAGLDGQGQEDFLEVLCGLKAPLTGQILIHTPQPVAVRNFHQAVRNGLVYLPRNRKTQGILPALSVLDNFSIASLVASSRFGVFNRRAYLARLEAFRQRLSIVYSSPNAPITSLSGGNQQKVLLARWMAMQPRLLLLNDPTRGVDLATRLKLYEVFRETVDRDKTALVILSTEIDEILQLCDKVLVFRDHHVFVELTRDRMTMSNVIAGMFGRHDGGSSN